MATRNAYLAYKRDTSRLVYWIVGASNAIIKSSPKSVNLGDGNQSEMNTTGAVTVATLVALSALIAKHTTGTRVPPTILRLFQSVIDARTATYAAFLQITLANPDPDVEKSNVSHKHFIDALTEAFHTLGGGAWKEESKDGANIDSDDSCAKKELDRLVLENRFGALHLGRTYGEDGELSDEGGQLDDDVQQASGSASQRRQQRRPGRGRKGKKAKGEHKSAAEDKGLGNLPLESYCILQDTDGIANDYMMAVHAFASEWAEFRVYVQDVWRDCAYYGMNSAVAGAISNLVIAMVQQTASAIFIDFPDHDAFGTLIDFLTRGDPETAQWALEVNYVEVIAVGPGREEKFQRRAVDAKEQLMIYTYHDFISFLDDFRKTRSGKPTKRMLGELRHWNPELDLQSATRAQRIQWRRVYTINWLYDLVNVFSSVVIQSNTGKGGKHALEDVDWSPQGPWHKHRRLFGLNEFAGFVTSLAMQKEGTDIRKRILPHYIFQLQCIIDSFMVSRGWSISVFRGHVLTKPASKFRPRRDVDLFLHQQRSHRYSGFLGEAVVLNRHLDRDAYLHQDPNRNQELLDMVEGLPQDFGDWLGEAEHMHELANITPSRFSSNNKHGLWEYSPFLCGVGLMEGLDLAYHVGMHIWERIPEPMLMIHLHNMLVQKGLIKRPMPLYEGLSFYLSSAFFPHGKPPTSNFAQALKPRMDAIISRPARRRGTNTRNNATAKSDRYRNFEVGANRFFKTESVVGLFRRANWNIDGISDSEIPFTLPVSNLVFLRIAHAKHVVDPATGQEQFEDRELVRRAVEAFGMTEEHMLEAAPLVAGSLEHQVAKSPEWQLPKSSPAAGKFIVSVDDRRKGGPNWRYFLELYKMDLLSDVSGSDRPLSAINYLSATSVFMMHFFAIEKLLEKSRNPLYVRAYETDPRWRQQKRAGLTYLALAEQDEECLEVMAGVLEYVPSGFESHVYWEGLQEVEKWQKARYEAADQKDDKVDDCCVM
jgi:hypothetical protein